MFRNHFWIITKLEIKLLHQSTIGYVAIGIYLLGASILFWVIDNPYNILNTGIADLRPFFQLSPWFFAFLVPILSMRSFGDEIQKNTIELIFTKPISISQLILGKFLGIFAFLLLSLLPTLVYFVAIDLLIGEIGYFDWGSHLTGILGIIFTLSVYIGICFCVSVLLINQILVLISSLVLCVFHFYGWSFLGLLTENSATYHFMNGIGIQNHFISLSRGIIKVTDLLYFGLNIISLFILNHISLQRIRNK